MPAEDHARFTEEGPGIEQRIVGFIATSLEAIIIVDDAGRVVLFNPAAERMFQYAAREALGSTVDRFIPERLRKPHREHMRRFADSGIDAQSMGTEGMLWGVRSDGTEFPFEATITQTKPADQKLFGIMLRDITERLNAATALKQSEEFNRSLVLHCPVAMVVTRLPEEKCEFVNRKFTELFGYTAEDVPDVEHWWPLAYPDEEYRKRMRAEWDARLKKALESSSPFSPFEALVHCKDGSRRYIEFGLSFVGIRSVVTFVDLTDRYLAELERRQGDDRYRDLAEVAPVMIWMTDPDGLTTYLSKHWIDFIGVPMEKQLGDGWADAIHPADRERCLQVFKDASAARILYRQEMRFRRHDGEYRWIYDTGIPRYSAEGEFAGYVGSCVDISERKNMEEALSTFGRRLLQAQEGERLRIARELHDDFGQRLAVIALEMQQGEGKALEHIRELAFDLQSLSHRLHSSSLDYFGLVVATSRLCKEVGERMGVTISFHSENVPRDLSADVRLCLFRVIQEALQNAVKHSKARDVELSLIGAEKAIHLTVRDSGVGFDPEEAGRAHGIGLISMRERLKLVKGVISIDSGIDRGTTIRASVPVILEESRRVAEAPPVPANT